MHVRRQVIVRGRVQNVWFRAATRAEAERLGLSGWVRNLQDGRVEFEAEGPDDAVSALLEWAHTGPPRAAVADVVVRSVPLAGGGGFEIRPDGPGQGRL